MVSIGRNDPCPCGSGQKYKKCCGAIVNDDIFEESGYTGKSLLIKNNQSCKDSDLSNWNKVKWQGHRDQVNKFLLSGIGRGNLLLIGAGNCNDFDLAIITEQFAQVIIVDYDSDSVNYALQQIPDNLRSKVLVFDFDVTGLYEEIIPDFLQKLDSLKTVETQKIFKSIIDNIHPPKLPDKLLAYKFDCIAFLGLFTQLFLPYFEYCIANNNKKKKKTLEPLAFKLTSALPELCIRTFMPLFHKGTQIFFYVDVLQFPSERAAIYNGVNALKAIQPEMIDRYGIRGGPATVSAFENITSKGFDFLEGWLWIFGQDKSYYVIGSSFTYGL